MSATKFLKCSCSACGKRIEYPAHAVGDSVECPHCGRQTELTVEVPEVVVPRPRRAGLIWLIAALVLLGILGALAPVLLRRMIARSRRSSIDR